jgi:hypothetical protein
MPTMVLTKQELIGSLQNEIRILLHLAGKVDRGNLDYRPSAKQRSTLELLQYLNIMGPGLVGAIKSGAFNQEAWGAAMEASAKLDLDGLVASIATQSDYYAREIDSWSDADFRGEVELFGRKGTRGSSLCNMVLAGHAAYRTQLFLYLKSSGREELNTMNLWAGVDGAM